MKRLVVASCFATFASMSSAHADGPYEPPPAPVSNWAGFYYGTSIGGIWSDFDTSGDSGSANGGLAGAQVGYNWQFDRLVLGFEGDWSVATADEGIGSASNPERIGIDSTGSLRARIGYDLGRTLIYAAGGLATADAEIDNNTSIGSENFWGWTVGAGVETKITSNLALRAEYRYSDFGSETMTAGGQSETVDITAQQFTVGFNYYLGAGVSPLSLISFSQPSAANWSGFYLGGVTGYVWADGTQIEPLGGINGDYSFDGWTAGVRTGYDWQAGNFVYGLVTDFSLSDAEDRGTALDNAVDLERIGIDYLGTIRARAGWAFGQSLIYATGGAAYAGLDLYDDGDNSTQALWGWTAGAGFETFITDQQSFSIEYLYADFGDKTFNVDGDSRNADLTSNIIRAGVSQRF